MTRRELTATELRRAAGKTKDARAARRMLVIALVLGGVDRATAAQWTARRSGEVDQGTFRGRVFPANARVGQQGTLTRIRAKRGTRPRAPRDTRTPWASPVLANRWRSRAHCSVRSARHEAPWQG